MVGKLILGDYMVRETFHQASNGLGKYAVVKETAMKNLAKEVLKGELVDCISSEARKPCKVEGWSLESFCRQMNAKRGVEE